MNNQVEAAISFAKNKKMRLILVTQSVTNRSLFLVNMTEEGVIENAFLSEISTIQGGKYYDIKKIVWK